MQPIFRLVTICQSPRTSVSSIYPARRCQRDREPRNRYEVLLSIFAQHQPVYLQHRALLTDLTAWVVDGTPPPASRYPTVAGGTLVPANRIGFPKIPGVNFTALYNTREFLFRG